MCCGCTHQALGRAQVYLALRGGDAGLMGEHHGQTMTLMNLGVTFVSPYIAALSDRFGRMRIMVITRCAHLLWRWLLPGRSRIGTAAAGSAAHANAPTKLPSESSLAFATEPAAHAGLERSIAAAERKRRPPARCNGDVLLAVCLVGDRPCHHTRADWRLPERLAVGCAVRDEAPVRRPLEYQVAGSRERPTVECGDVGNAPGLASLDGVPGEPGADTTKAAAIRDATPSAATRSGRRAR